MIFFDDVDMAGPFMPLEKMRTKIESAPRAAREHDDFKYLIGLYAGRQKFEPVHLLDLSRCKDMLDAVDVFVKKEIGMPLVKILTIPINELEDFIECASDAIRETSEFGLLVGCLDGQLIMTEFGGVGLDAQIEEEKMNYALNECWGGVAQ
jgi:hypothetical protein